MKQDGKETVSDGARFPWRMTVLVGLMMAAVIASFVLWGDAIDAWTRAILGDRGVSRLVVAGILFALLASDIVLPVPSTLASTACGLLLGPIVGFFVSFAAMSVSATIGYEVGVRCSGWARRMIGENDYACLEHLQTKGGRGFLLSLRPVPVLAEASTVFAGIGRMRRLAAYVQIGVGNAAVSAVYVATGVYFSMCEGRALIAFVVCLSLTGISMLVAMWVRKRKFNVGLPDS